MLNEKRGNQALRWLAAAAFALPVALVTMAALPAAAAVDPLQAAFDVALANPTNIQAQLAYARAAEAAGKPEAAFPVYERVLAIDPNNPEAKAGLRRIRAVIEPARNDTFVEAGTTYESNPLRVTSGANGEFQLFGNVDGTYERTLGEQRWRTVARLNGVWHGEQRQLNYGYAGAYTGPLFNIGADGLLNIGIGGGASTFSGRFFYYEALATATYEWGANGAQQTVRGRVAWRHYDPFWVSDQGFWADITGKFIMPSPQPGNSTVLTPWLRWSGVGGTFAADDGFGNELDLTPGRYTEAGGRIEYTHEISRSAEIGVNFSANFRMYTQDLVPLSTNHRSDVTASPGVSLIFPRVIGDNIDARVRYNYIWNNSNDNNHDYQDHVVMLSLGGKF